MSDEQRLKEIKERLESVLPEKPIPLQVLLDANTLLVMVENNQKAHFIADREVPTWNSRIFIGEEVAMVDKKAVLQAVDAFCAQYDSLGVRFVKLLKNAIRAVPTATASLAAPKEEAKIALSRQCDNYAHSKCAYPDRCSCDCHVRDQEWERFCEWFGRNDGRPMYDTESCRIYVRRAVEYAIKFTKECAAPPSSQHIKEAANAAATEICDYCGIDTNDSERVAEIIQRICFSDVDKKGNSHNEDGSH